MREVSGAEHTKLAGHPFTIPNGYVTWLFMLSASRITNLFDLKYLPRLVDVSASLALVLLHEVCDDFDEAFFVFSA